MDGTNWYGRFRQRLVDMEVGLLLKIETLSNNAIEFERIYLMYGDHAIDALMKRMKDDDWRIREQAFDKMCNLSYRYRHWGGDRAIPLLEFLRDGNGRVREAAARWALNVWDKVEKTEDRVLCLCLTSNKDAVFKMGEAAIPALIEILKDDTAVVRRTAAEALTSMAGAGINEVKLGEVRAALIGFVDRVRKRGNERETQKAVKEATGHYLGIAAARRWHRASVPVASEMEGMMLEGTPKPPKGETYRAGRTGRSVVS